MSGEFLAERLDRFMRESNISYHESGQSYIMECPVCHKRDKFYIRKSDGQARCWHCYREAGDPGGKPEFGLSLITGLSISEISSRLYAWQASGSSHKYRLDLKELFPVEEDQYTTSAPELPAADFPFGCYPLSDTFHSSRGVQYLEGRGVPQAVAEAYDVRYWTAQRKVVFPVIMHGRMVGWQWRTIDKIEPYEGIVDGKPKLITPPKTKTYEGLQRDRALMFHDRLLGSRHCVLAEGPFDALKAHLCGGNVATMGKVIGDSQLDLIAAAGIKRIYSGLDPDAIQTTADLARNRGVEDLWWMEIPKEYEDLGQMPMEHVLDIFHDAKRVFSTNVFISFG